MARNPTLLDAWGRPLEKATLVGYNSSVVARLAVAGTMPGSPTDKERLRIRVEGRWATMLNT